MSISLYPAVLIVLGLGIFAGALWLAHSLGYRRAVREYEVLLNDNDPMENDSPLPSSEKTET